MAEFNQDAHDEIVAALAAIADEIGRLADKIESVDATLTEAIRSNGGLLDG
jgi:hypothetical protein